MEDKRTRTQNFTSDEKTVLTELVAKYKDAIENKKTDCSTNSKKTLGWRRLCVEFNALSDYCCRTPESLKNCWDNIKRQTKRQSASRKREFFKTGGGRPQLPPSTATDRIVEGILGPALEGLENPYDCDFSIGNFNKKEKCEEPTPDNSQMVSDAEIVPGVIHIPLLDSEPSSSLTFHLAETSLENNKNYIGEQQTPSQQKVPKLLTQMDEENDHDLKWEGWTPKSLKRPISEVLRTTNTSKENKENNSWLKRRRPDHQNLNDQLIQEKLNLAKALLTNAQEEAKRKLIILDEQLNKERTLIVNAQEESKRKILILDEQLKQEKIKTQKLLLE